MEGACRVYRPRDPRKTALWGLRDTLYERVKGQWEERFERRYGFWRGLAGEWVPVPYVAERSAEELFRHKVLGLLRGRGLLSPERIELLLSWRRSGFSVHNRVFAHPDDGRDFEALARYMMRSPVSLAQASSRSLSPLRRSGRR